MLFYFCKSYSYEIRDRMQLYAKLPLPQHQYFPFVFHISYSEAVTLAEHQMTAKLCNNLVGDI